MNPFNILLLILIFLYLQLLMIDNEFNSRSIINNVREPLSDKSPVYVDVKNVSL